MENTLTLPSSGEVMNEQLQEDWGKFREVIDSVKNALKESMVSLYGYPALFGWDTRQKKSSQTSTNSSNSNNKREELIKERKILMKRIEEIDKQLE